ncbi:ArsR/SmtB family transcription factor [Antrihabitans sp. NCIMB 15449]|uniref:Winged helix-turn-helix transcriptional regulator n=2 Tax=Antrihabitans TaxID=2799491 RepID=A0A934NVY7_9NOCA|nr:metalloregulator ArsR/SmtB family transcription factor [Antrihabitans stalagmiti]MBJ8342579.1 winged helix-turn-helix transcriptional regulator [Antrihabitans stalagmiti]
MSPIFEALAQPVRRDILDSLRSGPKSVNDLVTGLDVSQPVVSKHLRILREAGFVTVRVDAQRRWYQLRAEPLMEVADWLEPYRWMWERRLDLLGDHLDTMEAEES